MGVGLDTFICGGRGLLPKPLWLSKLLSGNQGQNGLLGFDLEKSTLLPPQSVGRILLKVERETFLSTLPPSEF